MSFAGLTREDRTALRTTQATQRGFDCGSGSYCGNQMGTSVGTGEGSATTIFHRTKTTISEGKATTEVYILSDGKWVNAAKTTDGGKTYTFNEETRSDGSKIVGAGVRQSLAPGGNMNKNVQYQVTTTLREGGSNLLLEPKLTDNQIREVTSSSSQLTTPGGSPEGGNPPFSIQELNRSTISGKSRQSYGDDLRYPLKMNQGVEAGNKQDVIRFTLYEYVPPNESGAGVGSQFGTSVNSKTRITKSKPKGSAILPIQPTISDSNAVNWQSDSINPLELAAFNLSTGAIEGGITGFENALNTVIGAIGNENEQNIRNAVTAAFASAAIGKNVFTRATGAILNPNVELLFNGPSLRVFNYSFKLSARSKPESERIRQIIRFFKQGMSVQRTKSNLFLSSPDVFGISYLLRGDDDNPYMNRIKICALTNCSVDYTPTGSYMTFEDGSMVSYTLNLTFEELEPIYNDDYDELGENAIGY